MDLSTVEIEENSELASELFSSCVSETNKSTETELREYVLNGLESDIRKLSFSGATFVYQESYANWLETYLTEVIERLIGEKTIEIFERNYKKNVMQSIQWVMDQKCAPPTFVQPSLLSKLANVSYSTSTENTQTSSESMFSEINPTPLLYLFLLSFVFPEMIPIYVITTVGFGIGTIATRLMEICVPLAIFLVRTSLKSVWIAGKGTMITSSHYYGYWWSSTEIFEHYLKDTLSHLKSNFDVWGKQLIESFADEYRKQDDDRHIQILSQSQLLQSSLATSGIDFSSVQQDLKNSLIME